jgi:ATP-dependent DNA helicase RecG
MTLTLYSPIEEIPRVGPAFQKKLKRMGLKTVRDLLFHFPHRYEDFSKLTKISETKLNETICIQGKILEIKNIRTWKKRMFLTKAVIQDETAAIQVTWFNQPYLTKTLKKDDFVSLVGKTLIGKEGIYLANPAYEKMIEDRDSIHTGRIVPVYPETAGLSSRWLRYILSPLLVNIGKKIQDPLPEKIIRENNLLSFKKAIWQIHFPDSLELAKKAQERFSFEEIFFISLFTLRERLKISKEKSCAISINLPLIQDFVKTLPFKLTDAQKKSAWQILKDLEKPRPMNRLLEGDVGSGKTVVATMAALNTAKAGYQVAIMAPTEILAKQHFQGVGNLLEKSKLSIALLTGKTDKIRSKKLKNEILEISRQRLLERVKEGEIDILIGTHALIQDKVKFGNLALVIVDEQHRFGVEQRAKLCQNGKKILIPHLLSMTATPIPRTLALTIYGDLDLSLLNELPKGRKKIITKVINPEGREEAYRFIRKEVEKGRQIFVICPRIEPAKISDENSGGQAPKRDVLGWTEAKAVKKEYEKLSKTVFPDLKVGMLHGKMKPKEKDKIMQNLKNKKIDVLVSTSVVEVGIDIQNATVMLIEGTERFGLAQLYQFRGRVGRSKFQSYCFLFTDSPAQKTKRRLNALITAKNSFELAEKDLEIRGPGDFFGQRQWGIPDVAMNSLRDIFLVEKTKQAAKEILEENPYLNKYPLLKERVNYFQQKIHLE